MIYNLIQKIRPNYSKNLPKASEVLKCYLKQTNYPSWTSYFVRYKDLKNDHINLSCFVVNIDDNNRYFVLRTGCFPFIKYHCTKLTENEVKTDHIEVQNKIFNIIKIVNLGFPTLLYGLVALMLISHTEIVYTPKGNIKIYFLIKENKFSRY